MAPSAPPDPLLQYTVFIKRTLIGALLEIGYILRELKDLGNRSNNAFQKLTPVLDAHLAATIPSLC